MSTETAKRLEPLRVSMVVFDNSSPSHSRLLQINSSVEFSNSLSNTNRLLNVLPDLLKRISVKTQLLITNKENKSAKLSKPVILFSVEAMYVSEYARII